MVTKIRFNDFHCLVLISGKQPLRKPELSVSTGSSPNRMLRNVRLGTFFPSTTRQTVIGPDKISPTGPHSQLQNTAATSRANGEMPVLRPHSNGSAT